MKANIGVDIKNAPVHSLEGTTASVHDKKVLLQLLHGEESSVFNAFGITAR
jgi:IS5 family transposase